MDMPEGVVHAGVLVYWGACWGVYVGVPVGVFCVGKTLL